MLVKLIKSLFIKFFPSFYWSNIIYSQEGEDMVIDRYFSHKSTGFYVDVGCHHPFRFSNTYRFYKRGWRGICIDPLPECIGMFKKYRPNDVYINKAVGLSKRNLDYYMYNEPALNTFDLKVVERLKNSEMYKIIEVKKIDVEPLRDILLTVNHIDNIDFMSIDVEGLDYEVLQSFNWNLYRPKLMIVECLGNNGVNFTESPVYSFLVEKGYCFYAKTGNSIIMEYAKK